jgi:hypothetical protein
VTLKKKVKTQKIKEKKTAEDNTIVKLLVNIKFYKNRQIDLQMSMEHAKQEVTLRYSQGTGSVCKIADEYYKWLQDAPQADKDVDKWYYDVTTTKPKGKSDLK